MEKKNNKSNIKYERNENLKIKMQKKKNKSERKR